MNDGLAIDLVSAERGGWLPGATLSGVARWRLPSPAAVLELRLFWYTRGKGTQDVAIVQTIPLPASRVQGEHSFQIELPEGPYSFSGRLISLIWALELVAEPGNRAARVEFVLSPTGEEILIGPQAGAANA